MEPSPRYPTVLRFTFCVCRQRVDRGLTILPETGPNVRPSRRSFESLNGRRLGLPVNAIVRRQPIAHSDRAIEISRVRLRSKERRTLIACGVMRRQPPRARRSSIRLKSRDSRNSFGPQRSRRIKTSGPPCRQVRREQHSGQQKREHSEESRRIHRLHAEEKRAKKAA